MPTPTTPDWYAQTPQGLRLMVLIQPRASRNELVGIHDGRLKIRLKAPPVDGEANAELVAFLSKALALPKGAILLESGQTGRRKTLLLSGLTPEALRNWVKAG